MIRPILGALVLALAHKQAGKESRRKFDTGGSTFSGYGSLGGPEQAYATGENLPPPNSGMVAAPSAPAAPTAPTPAGALSSSPTDLTLGRSAAGALNLPSGQTNGQTGWEGGLPNAQTIGNLIGVNPKIVSGVETLAGMAVPPLGLAITAANAIGNVGNTLNNSAMLANMGDQTTFGQKIGGFFGGSLSGSPTQAMNGAMGTPNGRAALSTPQAQGELPGVSMPTQTSSVTPVSSVPLSGPQPSINRFAQFPGANGGGGGGGGFDGTQGGTVGGGGADSGNGMGTASHARGGKVKGALSRGAHRGRR